MPKLPLQCLLLWASLATTSICFAVSVKPQQVLDLHYGEVLFHFYQEDYFTSISQLMVAQQQNLLQHHQDESESVARWSATFLWHARSGRTPV